MSEEKDQVKEDLLLWNIAYEAGASAEREACARLVKSYDTFNESTQGWQDVFAIAIRARAYK
jgi:hypothetical protein